VGIFDPNTATWYLRNDNTPGAPHVTPFAYGGQGWSSVMGDWNGDGTTSIGVVDPATETRYLRNSNSPGPCDCTPFRYGAAGWIPVVGDWNGDGTTSIGVVDPATETWYLRNSNSPGPCDYTPFRYGAPGWIPVVGDWNGDGTITIGVVDPVTETWYLRNSNSPGAPDIAPFGYGGPGWQAVPGDWNGDGTTSIGVIDPASETWYLRNSNSPGAPNYTPFAYGAVGWVGLAGMQPPRAPVTGDYRAILDAVGPTQFGSPVGPVTSLGTDNVEYQQFQNGIIVGTTGQPLVTLHGAMYSHWQQVGGMSSFLSYPTSNEISIHNTLVQDFKGGWMMSNPNVGSLAMEGMSSHDIPLMVSNAVMSTNPQGLSLWTPVVDDIVTAAKDVGGAVSGWWHNVIEDPGVVDLRTPPAPSTPPVLPPAAPLPFHYDPTLIKLPPTQPTKELGYTETFYNGAQAEWIRFKSTNPTESWRSSPTANAAMTEAMSRLHALGLSGAIYIDPLFGEPVNFVLVDQIYDQNGNPLPQLAGKNYVKWQTQTSSGVVVSAGAARVIQIANTGTQENLVRTIVHEIGHSWNTYKAPTQGSNNSPWLTNHTQYFSQFMAVSGWSLGSDGTWRYTAPANAFVSNYAKTSPDEDWAETFELASRYHLEGHSLSDFPTPVQDKIRIIENFLGRVVPSEASLGGVAEEALTAY
jgi:hypothetical protein